MVQINNESQIPKQGTSILYFSGEHCSACQQLTPKLNQITENKYGRNLYHIDVKTGIGARYNVEYVPTIIVLNNGMEVKRAVGVKNIENI